MILYLDTSSWVKTLLPESGSEAVRIAWRRSSLVATSRIAYPELASALVRRLAASSISQAELTDLLAEADRHWRHMVIIDVNERRAAEQVISHRLRGMDAIHLAAALDLRDKGNGAIVFSSHDERLQRAAVACGLSAASEG